jgi:glycosyltransferase involved in cell wall biosynthesis
LTHQCNTTDTPLARRSIAIAREVPVSTTGIVHQIDPRNPVAGGIETCIAGIVRYAPSDEKLVVIGADRSGARPRGAGSTLLGELQWLDVQGRQVGFLPVARLGRRGRAGLVPETVTLTLGLVRFRHAIRSAVDHLQVHRSETGAVVSLLLPGIDRVQCIHGDSSRALRYRSASYWRFLRRAHLTIERWSVRRATWTHVFNRSGAARLARASSRVSYLPTWFDPEIVRTRTEPSADGHSRALWVGRLEEEKDPVLGMRALEAFVGRGGAGDARRAAMVGEGSLQASVLDERPAGSGVELRGSLSQADVAGEMAAADVLLMTSRFEGSPVVMNESLAAGTPVVGTQESDPDERIENGRNGFRCPERSAAALADAMATARSLSRSACIESVRELSAPLLVPRLFTTP